MAGQGSKQKILIIEDDRPLAGGLCRALQNETIAAESCHTLREAEKLLGKVDRHGCVDVIGNNGAAVWEKGTAAADGRIRFDLVLLDVNLPDGNGFDFLQKLKKEYDISVIMLTANDMETDIVAGLELGADDYITKPFSLAVLRARVETQLRRVAQGRSAAGGAGNSDAVNGSEMMGGMGNGQMADGSPELVGKGWWIDGPYRFHFAKMLFFHGEEQVELSKTEQRLLRMLIENKHVTLTRDQLLNFIWSVDAEFVDENTLSVTVKRLRDKLGAQERIKTVYGIGYRWE